ncbi:hypothetical protein WMY93_019722 [Mugilogobius chulae]|uniref:Uncharacterized protein n=1 Tax=Mugilogobius chulae TaxID=88201 RepID=A0AAW0NKV1_9GOBI
MEHSPSLNLSGPDGEEAEDPLRPLLPPRIILQPQACSSQCGIHHTVQQPHDPTVWMDRTQAMATTPLYNGHPYLTSSSPRPSKKVKGKEKKSERRSKNASHKGKSKNSSSGHKLQERVTSFTDVPLSQAGSPYKVHCRPVMEPKDGDRVCSISENVEMQERQTLPEIIITSRDDEPREEAPRPLQEVKTLLPIANRLRPKPNPLNLSPKTKANDDPYWKTHNIGWRLVRRRSLFLRRQRLNDSALAVGIFGWC